MTATTTNTNASTHQTETPPQWIVRLYSNRYEALALHFILLCSIAFGFTKLFEHLFVGYIDMDTNSSRLMFIMFEVGFIVLGVKTCIKIDPLHGYMLEYFGHNTEIILGDGLWPMYLFPLFSINMREMIDNQLQEVAVDKIVVADKDTYTFELFGILPYHIADEDGHIYAHNQGKGTFIETLKAAGRNGGMTAIMQNSFTGADSLLRNMLAFNDKVLEDIDVAKYKTQYGATIDKPLLCIGLTAETRKNFNIKMEAINKVLANKALGKGFAELVVEIKKLWDAKGITYTDAELREATNQALNGVNMYDFSGTGDSNSNVRLLNIPVDTRKK